MRRSLRPPSPHGCARLHRECRLAAARATTRPSEHLQRRRFDPRSQNLMEAIPGHDVGLAAENARGLLLHIHQLIEAKLASFVIEEQINVGIFPRLAARRRAEQIEMLNAKLP